MNIRKLELSEHYKTRKLYEEVFAEDSTSFVDYYYTEKTKDNQIYVVEEGEEILAMLHLNPFKMVVNDQVKDTDYIVAVATKKEYRSQGMMRKLLVQALNDMANAGEAFTFLMPAAEAIYTPYDFRTVYEQNLRFCPVKERRELAEDDGKTVLVSPLKEVECRELADTMNRKLRGLYQVFPLRSEAYYQRLIREYGSDGGTLMVYRKEGEMTDVLPWVSEKYDHVPKIMVRILDVKRMLLSLKLSTLTAVCFTVEDEFIPSNNCTIVVTGTEFSGALVMESKPENSEGTIPIDLLGEFLFGAKTIEELREEGVQMTDRMMGEMKKILPVGRIQINETV